MTHELDEAWRRTDVATAWARATDLAESGMGRKKRLRARLMIRPDLKGCTATLKKKATEGGLRAVHIDQWNTWDPGGYIRAGGGEEAIEKGKKT